MLAWLAWQLAKRRLVSVVGKYPPGHVQGFDQLHQARIKDFPPDTEPYRRLASLWDDFAGWFSPGYDEFLAAAAVYYGQPIKAVLDLACGTGLQSRRLARQAESVVGLDASEDMLREARSRTKGGNVRYLREDFRDFQLGETFDAAVCSGDSLNYIETPGELADVFRCVRQHLRPGGLFAFDVLDHRACLARNGVKAVGEVEGKQFEIYFFYDPVCRVSEARVVFAEAVERHRRISIDEEDVQREAGKMGLEVAEHFSAAGWLAQLLSCPAARQFYVLRRP